MQALPRLTNRDKVVEMVDPALHGQFSKKDLIQVCLDLYLWLSLFMNNKETNNIFNTAVLGYTDSSYCSHVRADRSRLPPSNDRCRAVFSSSG